MSALDAAKEILRITSTAGLSKDVVDLLEKKVALLTAVLSESQREIGSLKAENSTLRAQLQNLQPVAFQESMGVLWKRTPTGFESRPYCPECASRPVMMGFPPGGPEMWACPADHTFADRKSVV